MSGLLASLLQTYCTGAVATICLPLYIFPVCIPAAECLLPNGKDE